MSIAIAFKVVSPLIATGLIKALKSDSKLVGTVVQKAVDATGGELLKPDHGSKNLSQAIEAMTEKMASDIQSLFEGQDRQPASRDAIALLPPNPRDENLRYIRQHGRQK